jgi:hypothetical protein
MQPQQQCNVSFPDREEFVRISNLVGVMIGSLEGRLRIPAGIVHASEKEFEVRGEWLLHEGRYYFRLAHFTDPMAAPPGWRLGRPQCCCWTLRHTPAFKACDGYATHERFWVDKETGQYWGPKTYICDNCIEVPEEVKSAEEHNVTYVKLH